MNNNFKSLEIIILIIYSIIGHCPLVISSLTSKEKEIFIESSKEKDDNLRFFDLLEYGKMKPVELNPDGKLYDDLFLEALKNDKGVTRKSLEENSDLKKILNAAITFSNAANLVEGEPLKLEGKPLKDNEIPKTEETFPLPLVINDNEIIALRKKIQTLKDVLVKIETSSEKQDLLEKRRKLLINNQKTLLLELKRKFYFYSFMAIDEYQRFSFASKETARNVFTDSVSNETSKILEILKSNNKVLESSILNTDPKKKNKDIDPKKKIGDTVPVLFFPGVFEWPLLRDLIAQYEVLREDLIESSDPKFKNVVDFNKFKELIKSEKLGLDLRPDCLQALDLVEILAHRGNFDDGNWEWVNKACNIESLSNQSSSFYYPEIIATKSYIKLLKIERNSKEKSEIQKQLKDLIEFIEKEIDFPQKLDEETIKTFVERKAKGKKYVTFNRNRTMKIFAVLLKTKQQLDTVELLNNLSLYTSKIEEWHSFNAAPTVLGAVEKQLKRLITRRNWPEIIRLMELLPVIASRERAIGMRVEQQFGIIKELKTLYKNELKVETDYTDTFIVPVYHRLYPRIWEELKK